MIFILPRVFRRHIQGQTRKLHHLVHATWRPSCVRFDFKLYKMRTESENHENGRETLTSHVEAMNFFFGNVWSKLWCKMVETLRSPLVISRYHMWRSQGFNHVVSQLAQTFPNFSIDSTYHVKASRLFSWFSDSVRILYNFKSNLTQLGHHVSCTRWSSFHVCP
jgi:hypothetical protein